MHQITYHTYSVEVSKEEIESKLNKIAMENSDYGCGLPNNIKWLDITFNSERAACEYIQNIDKDFYSQIAVKFRCLAKEKLQNDEKFNQLIDKKNACYQKYKDLSDNVHYKNVQSSFIGCRHCESKISVKYLGGNLCPICFQDLRPKSVLERIESYKKMFEKADRAVLSYYDKKAEKSDDVKWLVKIEYHV